MSGTAVVAGAGVNELVAAHYLARAGHRVLVFDGRAGQDAATTDRGWIPERIVEDFALKSHGLKVHRSDPWIVAPLPAGGRLELSRDLVRSIEAIRRISPRDAAAWPAFCERLARLARLLETIYLAPPPDFLARGIADLARLAGLGLRVRRLGRQGIEDLLRFVPMSVADLLDDHFESDALKAVLGAAGVMHLCQGPRSGGTALRLLHHQVGSPAGVFRAPFSNIRSVLAALPGVELRRNAQVARITVREGRVSGVVLATGEEVAASVIASGEDPRRTLLELADPRWLDPALVRAVRSIRARGVVAQVTLALDQAPGFSTLAVAPCLDYLERAYDDAKHGRMSAEPYLEARNGDRTADGRHQVIVDVQFAPYRLADGTWDDDRRRALGDMVAGRLSAHVAGPEAIAVTRVCSPRDLEAEHGFPEGQAEHVEPALDQLLWMRPVPELARYRTPIGGLYLCGPGTHPGGSIAGASGYNAARVILRDRKNSAA